ncbi:Trp biosynthesis-associated membrane protein [Isoptericola variabilis]|uniref:Trp biosynthesis-associated membrane protein n=1 Tax=Isoptericola variabilis TaxID=139208 RepID=UPI00067419A4|nr:Trp biosynthesis-associated membrane protein [Isoptericola variabilis]
MLAAGLVLAIAGRVARWLALGVTALAGVLVTASAAAVLADPVPATTTGTTDATGVTDLASPVALTPWPWLAAAVGVLVVVRRGARRARRPHVGSDRGAGTSVSSTGTDAPDAGPAAGDGAGGDAPDAHDDWDALSRGTDPSADR